MRSLILSMLIAFIVLPTLQAFNQNLIKTAGTCTDAIAQNADEKWIKSTDLGSVNSKECFNRPDAIHDLVLKIYPEHSTSNGNHRVFKNL